MPSSFHIPLRIDASAGAEHLETVVSLQCFAALNTLKTPKIACGPPVAMLCFPAVHLPDFPEDLFHSPSGVLKLAAPAVMLTKPAKAPFSVKEPSIKP